MNKILNDCRSIIINIKSKLPRELITAVPPELQEQFYQYQLSTSTQRLKIFCGVLIVARIIHLLFFRLVSLFSETMLDILRQLRNNPFYVISFVLPFYLSATFFTKKGKNNVLWVLCHFFVIFNFILSMLHIFFVGYAVPVVFFWFITLFTLVPNLKPKVFIPVAIIYFVTTVTLLICKYGVITIEHGSYNSMVIEIFIATMIIKILLYNNSVKLFIDTFKIKTLNEKLEGLAVTDELTKLNNRRFFMDYIDMVWKQCQRLKLPLSILMIDVDYFKKYNDTLGHLEGDKALIAIAQCLKNHVKRDTDFIARFGGEEFVCVLPFIEKGGALDFAKSLVQSVEKMEIPHPMSECSKYVTISVGMATVIPNINNTQTQLLDEADKALYMAKESGRNQVIAK